MPRQLNIRSDEAYELAHRVARQSGKSVTEVVTQALRQVHGPLPPEVSPQDAAETYRMLMELASQGGERKKPGATSDRTDMYDEHGLPK
jgi:hypothetical protein